MTTITIPKEFAGKGDLILISRKDYEKLLVAKEEKIADIDTIVHKARRDYEQGNFKTHTSAKSLIAELRS